MAKAFSERRKMEIASYIMKNQHMTHKQRAYYLGLHYNSYFNIFREMIAEYRVFILKDDIIPELSKDSLLGHLGTHKHK